MDIKQLFSNQSGASLALARHVSVSALAKNANMILSPLSINVVASLIAAGSSSPTLRELLSYLNSNSIDDLNKLSSEIVSVVLADGSPAGGPRLSLGNGVWIQETLHLKPSFQYVVESVYNAASYSVDFLTKAEKIISQVNLWGEKQTNGLIKAILPPGSVDERTRLILANAIYFMGEWEQKFDPSRTKDDDFHLLGGNSVKAPFMTSKWEQFIGIFDGFKVLRLPYKQGEDKRHFSMYIYLPDSKHGLPDLLDRLGSQTGFIDQHLPHMKVELRELRIPKFKTSFEFEASRALQELGVSSAFTPAGGRLTEMVDDPLVSEDLFVTAIFHKAFIEVNEEGSEAAAVSGIVMKLLCVPSVDFVADHPFMFLIREDTTGVVLFVGHVLNPLQN